MFPFLLKEDFKEHFWKRYVCKLPNEAFRYTHIILLGCIFLKSGELYGCVFTASIYYKFDKLINRAASCEIGPITENHKNDQIAGLIHIFICPRRKTKPILKHPAILNL